MHNAPGWASAVDASSGRTYYYNEDGETSWDAPATAPSAIVRAPSKKFTANPMNPSDATPAAQTPAAQTPTATAPSSARPTAFGALYAADPQKRRRLGLIGLLALTLVVAGSLLVQHLASARQAEDGQAEDGWAVEGQVSGMAPGSSVTATLGSAADDSFLATQTLLASSSAGGLAPFAFSGLDPAKSYFLKYEGAGVGLRDAVLLTPPSGGARRRLGTVSLALGEATQAAPSSAFVFRWRADASRSGAAESASAVKPPTVEFEGAQLRLADDQAAGKLHHDHAIVLAAEWSSEYAFRLLATLAAVPQRAARSFGKPQSLAPSRWTLVDGELPDDIEIRLLPTGAREVRIARAAFVNAAPQVVSLDGVRGTFFSRRLHHAAVRFVTNDGADTAAVQHIAKTRYGITIASAALPAATYRTLTARTTAELAGDFQPFETHVSEPLLLLTMFEELPAGFHQVKGLAYVLRRADGHAHPLYPTAPAVAWPTAAPRSYIEVREFCACARCSHCPPLTPPPIPAAVHGECLRRGRRPPHAPPHPAREGALPLGEPLQRRAQAGVDRHSGLAREQRGGERLEHHAADGVRHGVRAPQEPGRGHGREPKLLRGEPRQAAGVLPRQVRVHQGPHYARLPLHIEAARGSHLPGAEPGARLHVPGQDHPHVRARRRRARAGQGGLGGD
jgi:hypothetical protein